MNASKPVIGQLVPLSRDLLRVLFSITGVLTLFPYLKKNKLKHLVDVNIAAVQHLLFWQESGCIVPSHVCEYYLFL